MRSQGTETGLAVRDLVAGYEPGLPIVRGVSLTAKRGKIVALLGPNGAGKSTLVKAMAGLVPVVSGQVTLHGREITTLPAHRMIHAGLAYVPQTENVFARMTVEENLALAAAILPAAARRSRIDLMYALFPDLGRQRSLRAGRLSGGQRQMLALARALVTEPRALLLDEPSAGLAPPLVEAVLAKLREVRDRGVAVLLVEQNVRAALAVADSACLLVEGRVRLSGPAATLAADPSVAQLYLGGAPAQPADAAPPGTGGAGLRPLRSPLPPQEEGPKGEEGPLLPLRSPLPPQGGRGLGGAGGPK